MSAFIAADTARRVAEFLRQSARIQPNDDRKADLLDGAAVLDSIADQAEAT